MLPQALLPQQAPQPQPQQPQQVAEPSHHGMLAYLPTTLPGPGLPQRYALETPMPPSSSRLEGCPPSWALRCTASPIRQPRHCRCLLAQQQLPPIPLCPLAAPRGSSMALAAALARPLTPLASPRALDLCALPLIRPAQVRLHHPTLVSPRSPLLLRPHLLRC
jgi:hypothetical protein